jgi:rhodanese-related sulfurtransferase
VTSAHTTELSSERAAALLGPGAVFIDARPSTEYEASGWRIPGARQVGAGSGVDILEALKATPDELTIVVYCDDPDQACSALIARRARELGLGHAFHLVGGFGAWRRLGLPVERIPDLAIAPEAQPGG